MPAPLHWRRHALVIILSLNVILRPAAAGMAEHLFSLLERAEGDLGT